MSKSWPLFRGSFSAIEILQGSTSPVGTIVTKTQRRPVPYMAGGQFGLIKLADKSYRVEQLWVKQTVSSNNYVVAYPRELGEPLFCNTGEVYSVDFAGYGPEANWQTAEGTPLPNDVYNSLICIDNQYKFNKGGRPSFNHTTGPFYYLLNGNFLPYPDEFERMSTSQAQAWITATRSRQTAASRPSWASTISESGDYRERLLPAMRSNMQALLSQDSTYANIMRLAGNDRDDPRVRVTAVRILEEKGYSKSNIEWFFNPRANPGILKVTSPGGSAAASRGSGGSGGSGGVSRPSTFIAPTPAVTRVVVRAPFGYSRPPDRAPDQRPQIIQNYTEYVRAPGFSGGYREVSGQDIFVFPYVPNNISYSGLGSQWTEIDRQGNYPLVEWTKWDLMRVEMEFLLAEERTESGGAIVPDGIFNSVQGRLNTLRRMSQRRAAVSVFNLDDLFRVQIKRAAETGKAMQFVIADLTVNASRRSLNSVSKEITAATVKLTLQEIPIEAVTIVRMSPPKMTDPTLPKKTDEDSESSDVLFTDIWSAKPLS